MNLKWLYKIYSDYDGFRPAVIPNRMLDGDVLELGWERYLDDVDTGAEVWIFFHGSHRFENGVYAKGIVRSVDRKKQRVFVRVHEHSTTTPLTDASMSARVAHVVRTRNRQVFLFPTELEPVPACDITGAATTCAARQCASCHTWQSFPLIRPSDVALPERVTSDLKAVVPAYWVIPARCYLHKDRKEVRPGVRRASEQFYRFKTGDDRLAFPLALAMFEALRERHLLNSDFDAVVPIPLSPEKEARREIHRTRLLARELARLLAIKSAELLSLNRPISKRALQLAPTYFEARYTRALEVSSSATRYSRILLVDDVATWGSTIHVAATRLVQANPRLEVVAVTAGRMILKSSVRNEARIVV